MSEEICKTFSPSIEACIFKIGNSNSIRIIIDGKEFPPIKLSVFNSTNIGTTASIILDHKIKEEIQKWSKSVGIE